jgi:HJR/Mrr/RecB family endonuclease
MNKFIGIILLFLVVFGFIGYIKGDSDLGVAVAIGLVGVLVLVIRNSNKKEAEKQELENEKKHTEFVEVATRRIQSVTAQHIRTLTLKYDQTVSQDEYGNYLFDRWFQALDYFIDNVLRKDDLISRYLLDEFVGTSLADAKNDRLVKTRKVVTDAIFEYKRKKIESDAHLSVDVDSLDPIQFEHYCADILRSSGWDVRVTNASGDQGIDVIANRGNLKAVLQCKKYSQPVGNAAVQEIIAGKQFEQADIAAVVSNNSYTQSAKQLANVAGIYLLHYAELEQFAEKGRIA